MGKEKAAGFGHHSGLQYAGLSESLYRAYRTRPTRIWKFYWSMTDPRIRAVHSARNMRHRMSAFACSIRKMAAARCPEYGLMEAHGEFLAQWTVTICLPPKPSRRWRRCAETSMRRPPSGRSECIAGHCTFAEESAQGRSSP